MQMPGLITALAVLKRMRGALQRMVLTLAMLAQTREKSVPEPCYVRYLRCLRCIRLVCHRYFKDTSSCQSNLKACWSSTPCLDG